MRTFVTLTSALLTLALPAVSSASDPLLSGYGGPGNSEQAVLGGHLVTPPLGGSGSGGGAPDSLRATTTTSSSTSSSASSAGAGRRPPSSSTKSTTKRTSAVSSTSKPAAPTVAASTRVAYPSRERGAAGLPLSGSDVLLGLLALIGLVLGGFGLRRMAIGLSDDTSPPQAPAR